MITYATRAIPWPTVLTASGLVVLLMELVHGWPYRTWALQGTAVGVLAAGTAWSLDERTGPVVDASPRSLAWRTGARLPAIAGMAGVWVLVVHHSWDSFGGHGGTVLLHGLGAMTVAGGWTTWRRTGGEPAPGTAVAVGVIPIALLWGLTRLSTWVPIFPYIAASPEAWSTSTVGWWAAAVLAVVGAAAALCDARWWRLRRRDLGCRVPPHLGPE